MIPQTNAKAPEFSLPNENGNIVKLSDFTGKPVVLYFYPKDETPGCTVEACNFRDNYQVFKDAGIVVLGVSPDSSRSHTHFIEKHQLPFSLLADEDHAVSKLYGVWGKKKFMGKEYDGVFRTTFAIGANGKILKVFKNVKPAEHARDVLEAFK